MTKRTRLIVAVGAAALVAVGGGVGIAATRDDDRPLQGEVRDRAEAAALDHVGGGKVTETEGGEDGGAYEVGVRRADGTEIEVRLDADYNVVGTEKDDDRTEDDRDGAGQ